MTATLRASEDMAEAERQIRAALDGRQPGQAMSELMALYQAAEPERRDAMVAVLITRVAVAARDTGRECHPFGR